MSEDMTQDAFEGPNVEDLINQAIEKDYNGANKVFGDIMTLKMNDMLDQEQVRLADQIFNGAEDEADVDDEQLELDLEAEGELESNEPDDEEDDEVEEEDSLEEDDDEE
jgi:hypothetical protein